jgi:hypothetical protein
MSNRVQLKVVASRDAQKFLRVKPLRNVPQSAPLTLRKKPSRVRAALDEAQFWRAA